ncbi:MAG: electron transport complex subunit E [Thiotrichales bacterium]
MNEPSIRQLLADGLWHNNTGLVQLLGLCPLLAVTSNIVNGLGLGLATLLTLVVSNVSVSLARNLIRPEVRIPVFVLLIASIVTAIELLMSAYFHELYNILGIFIPLIVTNCAVIGRAEAFASKHGVRHALADGFAVGGGFALVLVTLGALRELVGKGTLFEQAHLMFGPAAVNLKFVVVEDYAGLLIAVLPPGAFFALGALIALKNVIDGRRARKPRLLADNPPQAVLDGAH